MRQGYHATSIDDIARALGSTKGRVYHHFASKIDLFFAVHREGMKRLFDAVVPVVQKEDTGQSTLETLEAMLQAHALALLEHHTYESVVVQGVHLHRFGAMTPEERQTLDELIASRDAFESLFKGQLARLKKAGFLRHASVSVAAKTLLGGIQWSLVWYRPDQDTSPASRESLAREMVNVLMHGLVR
ncbi:TetR/AcrR family transcriptional regulator [Orrella marina]|uniref:TetR/AcrR family transcriptional regulator n=2 Tax=Orrella marina TaxID=2163011 RepID=A0A2R4XP46_9BURK|nr:TetR/AcrR family transcriptional regulator [Orrella marina]